MVPRSTARSIPSSTVRGPNALRTPRSSTACSAMTACSAIAGRIACRRYRGGSTIRAMEARRAPWSAITMLLVVPLASASRQEASGTRIVFHESAVADLYYHVRAAKDAAEVEAFAPAVRAAQALDRALGGQAL